MKTHYTKTKLATALLLVLSLTALSACKIQLNVDGETVADINITKTGIISNIDRNITVNNTPFETSNTTVVVDGVETDVSELKEGMIVTVIGTESSNGSASANMITYTDDVEGEVLTNSVDGSGNGTLNVLGQTILVSTSTIFESSDANDISIADIDVGNIVEVSGYTNGSGEIQATRIEVKYAEFTLGKEMELKGNISNLNGNIFNIGGLTINADSATLDDNLMGMLKNGLYIEVSSYEGLDANGNFIANKIKLENEGSKDIQHDSNNEKVEIKGAVTMVLSNGQLEINGSKMRIEGISGPDNNYANLTKGTIVEAEGYINNDGVFVATKLEIETDLSSDSASYNDEDHDSNDNDNEIENSDDERESDRHEREDD